MTLAAVRPTFRPSIWLLSWFAMSSQWSARAGEAVTRNTAASHAIVTQTIVLANVADFENSTIVAIADCPLATMKPQAGGSRKGGMLFFPVHYIFGIRARRAGEDCSWAASARTRIPPYESTISCCMKKEF